MEQSRLESLAETVISTVVGFVVTLVASPIIYPLFGHSFTGMQNIGIVLCFTVISMIRQYTIRRWASKYLRRLAKWIARKVSRS